MSKPKEVCAFSTGHDVPPGCEECDGTATNCEYYLTEESYHESRRDAEKAMMEALSEDIAMEKYYQKKYEERKNEEKA